MTGLADGSQTTDLQRDPLLDDFENDILGPSRRHLKGAQLSRYSIVCETEVCQGCMTVLARWRPLSPTTPWSAESFDPKQVAATLRGGVMAS